MVKIRAARLVMLGALLAFALTAAGCGEMSKAEYQREVEKVGRTAEKGLGQISQAGNQDPDPAEFKAAAASLRKAANDLEDITPPEEVRQPHNDMIDGIRSLADLMDELAVELPTIKKDPASAMKLLEKIQSNPGIKKLDKAKQGFDKAGYTVMKPAATAK